MIIRKELDAFEAIDLERAELTKFNENKNYELITIPFAEDKMLIAVHQISSDGFFVGSFEHRGKVNGKGEVTGVNYLRTSDGQAVLAEKFVDNIPTGSSLSA